MPASAVPATITSRFSNASNRSVMNRTLAGLSSTYKTRRCPVPVNRSAVGSCTGWRAGSRLGKVHAHVDPEFRTLSRHAAKADVTAHQFGEALGDHQSDAGALDRAGFLTCALKGLEEFVLLLQRDPRAGVAHGDAQSVGPR